MPDEYTGKKWFTIHKNDAGREAYREEYVEWLLNEVKALREALNWCQNERIKAAEEGSRWKAEASKLMVIIERHASARSGSLLNSSDD